MGGGTDTIFVGTNVTNKMLLDAGLQLPNARVTAFIAIELLRETNGLSLKRDGTYIKLSD